MDVIATALNFGVLGVLVLVLAGTGALVRAWLTDFSSALNRNSDALTRLAEAMTAQEREAALRHSEIVSRLERMDKA